MIFYALFLFPNAFSMQSSTFVPRTAMSSLKKTLSAPPLNVQGSKQAAKSIGRSVLSSKNMQVVQTSPLASLGTRIKSFSAVIEKLRNMMNFEWLKHYDNLINKFTNGTNNLEATDTILSSTESLQTAPERSVLSISSPLKKSFVPKDLNINKKISLTNTPKISLTNTSNLTKSTKQIARKNLKFTPSNNFNINNIIPK